jgi:WD40 repeat protein
MLSPESLASRLLPAVLAASVVALLGVSGGSAPPSGGTPPHEQLHDVLGHSRLSPPLRGTPQQVRFSSDGKYLLVQLESGIYVVNRHPLEAHSWIYAPDVLPARFSQDSETLILATRNLAITRWNVAAKQGEGERTVKQRDGLCLASELSPHGDFAACLDPSLALELYRTNTGEQIFGEQVFTEQEKLEAGLVSVGLIHRNLGTAYSEMFGYGISYTRELLAERGSSFGPHFVFSPDAHFLLMLDRPHRTTVCVDVNAHRKIGCPGIIKNHWNATICFVAPSQIAVLDPDNPEKSQIAEFPGGQFVTKLHLTAHAAAPATQPKYLVVRGREIGTGKQNEVLFDCNSGRTLRAQEETEMDFTGDILASYSQSGEIRLVHVPDAKLESEAILPEPLLPTLRTAIASPSLDAIVLGVRGDAGLFRTATGTQVTPLPRLGGAWFAGNDELYIEGSYEDGSSGPVKRVNPSRETTLDAWSPAFKSDPQTTILDTHPGGPVLFVLEQPTIYAYPNGQIIYAGDPIRSKLRALDLKSGRELWSRHWERDLPVPYADPQGERVALGWRATMSGGQALAKRYPALKKQMDAVKLTINDAVFEVLDAVSGKTVGTALVRVGWGPESFDALFSVGDFLICVRDGARVTVYSLSTDEIQSRMFGRYVSASAATGLLSAADGNHLRLYDLKSGTKKDEYLFSAAPLYTHFSADGKRLLVLTADQILFVMDVTGVVALSGPHGSSLKN